jgi:hypothetical protein
LLDKGGPLIAETMIIVARSRTGLGKTDKTTSEYLKKAASLSLNNELQLMLDLAQIEFNLATGAKPKELPKNINSRQNYIKAWVLWVKGLLKEHKGQIDDAIKEYAKAIKQGRNERCWFSDLAKERIEFLTNKKTTAEQKSSNRDEAVLRKKRRRR